MNSLTITPPHANTSNSSPPASQFQLVAPFRVLQEQPSQFTAALAHEIRNPLTNIKLAAQMLSSVSLDVCQQTYLDIILRGSARINDIVTDLLVPSRPVETELETYSIHQLLDEVISLCKDKILLKNISVVREYALRDCKVQVNGPQMKIALTNIVINAIDAMPPEQGQLKLVAKSMNRKYIIQIEDNGTGISKANLKTIFNPYFTNKPGGIGLGLSTTLNILLANHVRTHVQSEEGVGTRFILSFDRMPAYKRRGD